MIVNHMPGYFDYVSSDESVAAVEQLCAPIRRAESGDLGREQELLVAMGPFVLDALGTFQGQDFAPGFPMGTSDFGGRCSQPSHFVIRFSLDGTALYRPGGVLQACTSSDAFGQIRRGAYGDPPPVYNERIAI